VTSSSSSFLTKKNKNLIEIKLFTEAGEAVPTTVNAPSTDSPQDTKRTPILPQKVGT
jgi:hypothetical protein